jgi:hypothetical protein
MPAIAPVKVNIEAVDKVTAPIRRIESTLGGMRSKMASVLSVTGALAAALAGVATAAAAASAKLFTSFVERASEVHDAAQRIGMSAETLQAMRYSAEQAGVGTEALGVALQKFLLMPGARIEDVTGRIADAFARIHDSSAKLRLAKGLFGRGGAALIPWLGQGSKTVVAQMKEARDLGIVIGEDAVDKADELGDRFGTLTKAARGIADAVSASITPDVLKSVNELLAYLAKNRESVVTGLTDFARDLLAGARSLAASLPDLKLVASDFATFAREVGPTLRNMNAAAGWLNRTVGPQAGPPLIDVPGLLRRGPEGAQRGVDTVTRVVIEAAPGTSATLKPGSRLPAGVTIAPKMGPIGPGWGRGHVGHE